jgi:hypothetical protein
MKTIALAIALFCCSCAACADDPVHVEEAPDPSGGIMPAFTFTAVSGTDVITTSAPHGLTTGDGPAATRNVGGALPGNLAAVTDYWAIVTGASTLKLALSSADALANVPIDLSTNGTGTNYLEIGVPYRRPRTYGVGSQLKSADLNANFDAWKALHALVTGQSETVWNGAVSLAGLLSVGGASALAALTTSGLITANGGVTVASGPLTATGIVTPGANLPTGTTNDYSPTGLASAVILRLASDAGAILTGIAGGSSGRVITLLNVGVNDLDIANDNGIDSTAANRFILVNQTLGATADVALRKNGAITLWYDATTSRWRTLSQNL